MGNTIPYKVGGRTVEFPILTAQECVNLIRKTFEEKREKLLADMREAETPPDKKTELLAALRAMEGSTDLLLAHVRTLEGTSEVIALSTKRMNGTAPKESEMVNTPLERFELAARLCGFITVDNPEANANAVEDEDGFVRPTNPASATG